MKPTSTLLALMLVTSAAPALAQSSSYSRRNDPPPQAQPQPQVAAQAPGQAAVKPSQGAMQSIIALQKAYASKDPAAISSALAAANAAATTKEDRYVIGQLRLSSALAASDHAATGAAIEAIAASTYLPQSKVAELYLAHGNGYWERKQYAEAAAAFERGLALDPNNTSLIGNLAEARYAQGRVADAIPHFQKLIAVTSASGAKPGENVYKRAVSIANEAKLPIAVDLSRAWLTAYPSADSWRNAIALYQNSAKPDAAATLDLLRLMRAAGALSTASHYSLYATAAAGQSMFGEAQAVIDEGLSKQAINANDALIQEIVAGLKGKPMPDAADLAVAINNAKTGTAIMRVGDRYFGLGDYAKAAEIYRKAVGQPGVDPNLVNLHLGMALARSGDKAAALEALKKVSGPQAAIAQYWTIFVNQG